ncbi:MAG: ribose 5-phosphate isomerase B [Bacteroidetes bacterium]|nr:MAG: ribose 5-phosphate isomerase B [Bacteroidota bacterium]
MKISIGSDHAGFDLKEKLKKYLMSKNIIVIDKGTHSADSVDYPDYGHAVAQSVLNKECDFGIAICGSGNGINMAVNKHKGIRGALCWNEEIARLAKQHNDANVLSLPGRFIDEITAQKIVDAFISAEFEGGRHQRRIQKIDAGC